MMDEPSQTASVSFSRGHQLVDDLIRLVGWSLLKSVTAGRYRSTGDHSDRLFEGTLGFLVVAGLFALGYHFF
jgi:hypothetical protein